MLSHLISALQPLASRPGGLGSDGGRSASSTRDPTPGEASRATRSGGRGERRPGYGPAFIVDEPASLISPAVFASAHSGRCYPDSFMAVSRASLIELRRVEDAYVDRLLADVSRSGAPLLCGLLGRAFVDLNRAETELDASMFESAPMGLAASRALRTPRVDAGLGCLPRVAFNGRPIYAGKLPSGEAEARLSQVHRPYHAALAALLNRAHAMFGAAWLIDCHSMPSDANGGQGSGGQAGCSGHAAGGRGGRTPDIVLGDRFGAACAPDFTDLVERLFRSKGYSTARNAPYAGGYATTLHGRPAQNRHALQIEIRRDLYLNEADVEPDEGFARLRADLTALSQEICAFARWKAGLPAAGVLAAGHKKAAPEAGAARGLGRKRP